MSLFVDIEKTLGSFHLQVCLEAENEVLALLGASGCGKSLTLRCIAGIEKPDRGKIVLDGVTLFDSERRIDLTPQQRHTGLLFQNYALFPNMTVEQNLLAGARRDADAKSRRSKVRQALEHFGLTELRGRLPAQLSGGQQQRVALARILLSEPKLLLLDEPFSALDSHLRFRLEGELRKLLHEFGKPTLLVSHDRDEVYRLSDKIAVVESGRICAYGSKKQVFADPGTRYGAVLTGCKNISAAAPDADGLVAASDWGICLRVAKPDPALRAVGIRMHDIRPGVGENHFRCRVVDVLENPFSYTVLLQPLEAAGKSQPLGWEVEKALWHSIQGDEIDINLPPEALVALRA